MSVIESSKPTNSSSSLRLENAVFSYLGSMPEADPASWDEALHTSQKPSLAPRDSLQYFRAVAATARRAACRIFRSGGSGIATAHGGIESICRRTLAASRSTMSLRHRECQHAQGLTHRVCQPENRAECLRSELGRKRSRSTDFSNTQESSSKQDWILNHLASLITLHATHHHRRRRSLRSPPADGASSPRRVILSCVANQTLRLCLDTTGR